MISKSLLKNFIYTGTVPTADNFEALTDVFKVESADVKVVYILSCLTEHNFSKDVVSNTEQYYRQFLTSLFTTYGISEEHIDDIAKLVYIVRELTSNSSLSATPELDDKIGYILPLVEKADEIHEQDDYYFVTLYRVASVFLCLSLEDFNKYHSVSATCCALYLKYFKEITGKYDEVVLV